MGDTFAGPTWRIAQQPDKDRDEKPGKAGHLEHVAPAEIEKNARQDERRCPSQGHRQVEERKCSGPRCFRNEVANKRWADDQTSRLADRSEERRVGKECRYRWSPYH